MLSAEAHAFFLLGSFGRKEGRLGRRPLKMCGQAARDGCHRLTSSIGRDFLAYVRGSLEQGDRQDHQPDRVFDTEVLADQTQANCKPVADLIANSQQSLHGGYAERSGCGLLSSTRHNAPRHALDDHSGIERRGADCTLMLGASPGTFVESIG
jgi:hypothetical protein